MIVLLVQFLRWLLLLLLGYGWVSIEYSDSEMSLMMAGGMYTAAAPPAAEVVLT